MLLAKVEFQDCKYHNIEALKDMGFMGQITDHVDHIETSQKEKGSGVM